MLSSLIATVVSSAKSVKFDRSDKDGSSFMYTRNSNGQKNIENFNFIDCVSQIFNIYMHEYHSCFKR